MQNLIKKISYYTFIFLLLTAATTSYCIDNNQYNLELLYTSCKVEYKNNTDSSIKLSELGLKLALQLKETDYQIKFLKSLIDNYNMLYNNKLYEYYTLQLIEILQKEKKYKELSSVYLNFSSFYGKSSNYNQSFIYTNKLIELAKKTADSLMLAKSYSNLGTILLALKDNKNALLYLNKGLHLLKNIEGNNSLKVSINNNIAIIYGNEELFDKSLEHQLTSLKLLENTKNFRQLGLTQLNIGYTFSSLKQYQKSLIYLNNALTNALQSDDKFLIASIYKNLGYCYLTLKRYNNAFIYIKKAESLAVKTGNIITLSDSYEILSDYYFINKEYKLAYNNYEKYQKLSDSLFKSKNNKNVSELKIIFETNEKEKENQLLKQREVIKQLHIQNQKNLTNLFRLISLFSIAIVIFVLYRFILKKKENKKLNEKNELITIQNQKLEDVNNTKDKFFSIIAKDIKEPFFEIKKSIEELSELSDIHNNEWLYKIADRIKENSINAGKLLENLLIWAKVQRGIIVINKEKIHLKTCVLNSIKMFNEIAEQKKQKVTINIPEEQFIYADKYTIEFVIGSIFNNSVKFTPTGGIIEISTTINIQFLEISIIDNGVGISKERLEKLFNIGENNTTLSTENKKGSGLGLHICNEFVKINNGKMLIESTLKIGTTVTIYLPLSVSNTTI